MLGRRGEALSPPRMDEHLRGHGLGTEHTQKLISDTVFERIQAGGLRHEAKQTGRCVVGTGHIALFCCEPASTFVRLCRAFLAPRVLAHTRWLASYFGLSHDGGPR